MIAERVRLVPLGLFDNGAGRIGPASHDELEVLKDGHRNPRVKAIERRVGQCIGRRAVAKLQTPDAGDTPITGIHLVGADLRLGMDIDDS